MGWLDEWLNSGATVGTRLRSLDAKNRGSNSGLLSEFANPDAVMNSQPAGLASNFLGPMGMAGVMTYHGTPHLLKNYDLSKVGTGQGAQSYGHGIYFAESPQVAKSYHEMLAGPELKTATGETINANGNYGGTTADHAAQYIYMQQKIGAKDPIGEAQKYVFGDLQTGLRKGINDPSYIESRQAIMQQLQEWKDAGVKPTKSGGVYKQDLPDEMLPKMLQWDKPFGQQPQPVRAALEKATGTSISPEMSAEEIYRYLGHIGGPSEASSLLAKEGIPGVSYLDAGSRAAGKGTMNHVVWDQELLNRMLPQLGN